MSRRFYLTHAPADVVARFAPLGAGDPTWRWPVWDEIGTGQTAPLLVCDDANGPFWERARWGLVPANTPDEATATQVGERLIWARADTIATRPAFRDSFARRRCIVPATGFFAWAVQGGERTRLRVSRRDGELLSLAGVWDEWLNENGQWQRTFSLISVDANSLLAPLSARMPALLRDGEAMRWLDPDASQNEVRALLRPLASRELKLSLGRGELSPELRAELLQSTEAERRARRVFPTRRVLKRDEANGDGKVFFSTRSWTTQSAQKWHPVVDTHDGGVWCDCPDFRYRYARFDPTLQTPHLWCKHVSRAVRNCARHGELKVAASDEAGLVAA